MVHDKISTCTTLFGEDLLALDVNDFFSSTYEQARSRFRESAQRALQKTEQQNAPKDGLQNGLQVGSLESFRVPSRVDHDLTVEYAFLPSRESGSASHLLLVTSGVHGSEAFAGSAAQILFLDRVLSQTQLAKTDVFLVHCLNPYGCKYQRRATENNVNLNRNFSLTSGLYQTKNSSYERLRAVLEPKGKVLCLALSQLRLAVLLWWQLKFGGFNKQELSQGIGQGQFESPEGVEFGGHKAEPQVVDFFERLQARLAGYKSVVLLDLHTGLGDKYQLHVMPADSPEAVHAKLFAQLFGAAKSDVETQPAAAAETMGEQKYMITTGDDDGFYRTSGDLNNVIPSLLSAQQNCVAVTLEFGTLGSDTNAKLSTLARVVAENQGRRYGYWHSLVERRVKAMFVELFYPSDMKWRESVLDKSKNVFERVLRALEADDEGQ